MLRKKPGKLRNGKKSWGEIKVPRKLIGKRKRREVLLVGKRMLQNRGGGVLKAKKRYGFKCHTTLCEERPTRRRM